MTHAAFKATMMRGKFQGMTAATTPIGSRSVYPNMAPSTGMVLPQILSAPAYMAPLSPLHPSNVSYRMNGGMRCCHTAHMPQPGRVT